MGFHCSPRSIHVIIGHSSTGELSKICPSFDDDMDFSLKVPDVCWAKLLSSSKDAYSRRSSSHSGSRFLLAQSQSWHAQAWLPAASWHTPDQSTSQQTSQREAYPIWGIKEVSKETITDLPICIRMKYSQS